MLALGRDENQDYQGHLMMQNLKMTPCLFFVTNFAVLPSPRGNLVILGLSKASAVKHSCIIDRTGSDS